MRLRIPRLLMTLRSINGSSWIEFPNQNCFRLTTCSFVALFTTLAHVHANSNSNRRWNQFSHSNRTPPLLSSESCRRPLWRPALRSGKRTRRDRIAVDAPSALARLAASTTAASVAISFATRAPHPALARISLHQLDSATGASMGCQRTLRY
jgi:hypothetical protein